MCSKKLKAFLAPEVRKLAPIDFLDAKNADRILASFSSQSLLINSLFAISINHYITNNGLILSI